MPSFIRHREFPPTHRLHFFRIIPLLISLLRGTTLTPDIMPPGGWAFPLARDFPRSFEIRKQGSNPLTANTRTDPLDIRETKSSRLSANRSQHHFCFRSPGGGDLTHAVFKFSACDLEGEQNVIDEWPKVMPAIEPPPGALFQSLVVTVLFSSMIRSRLMYRPASKPRGEREATRSCEVPSTDGFHDQL